MGGGYLMPLRINSDDDRGGRITATTSAIVPPLDQWPERESDPVERVETTPPLLSGGEILFCFLCLFLALVFIITTVYRSLFGS